MNFPSNELPIDALTMSIYKIALTTRVSLGPPSPHFPLFSRMMPILMSIGRVVIFASVVSTVAIHILVVAVVGHMIFPMVVIIYLSSFRIVACLMLHASIVVLIR